MKRYNPWGKIIGRSKLREDEDGDYVLYENVQKIIRKLLKEHTNFSYIISDEDIKKYIELN